MQLSHETQLLRPGLRLKEQAVRLGRLEEALSSLIANYNLTTLGDLPHEKSIEVCAVVGERNWSGEVSQKLNLLKTPSPRVPPSSIHTSANSAARADQARQDECGSSEALARG